MRILKKGLISSSFNGEFERYEKNSVEVLNNHTPKKVKRYKRKGKSLSK